MQKPIHHLSEFAGCLLVTLILSCNLRCPESSGHPTTSSTMYPLPHERRLVVQGTQASILDSQGNVVSANESMIRLRDEQGRCPSDGLRSVKVQGENFVLEQQNCSGWFLISEESTFEDSGARGGVRLSKMLFTFYDRREPESEPQVYLLTKADFGLLRFEDVRWDVLYSMVERP